MDSAKTPIPLTKKNIIVLIVIIIVITTIVLLLFNSVYNNTGEIRSEKDYSTHVYTIKQIWERKITDRGSTKYRYDFIELQGEDFNLSLPIKHRNTDSYREMLSPGDKIEVKVYTPELEEMQSKSIIKKVKRFMIQDNREVEVYKLSVNNKIIFDKDIQRSDVNFRKGGDLSASRLLLVFFGFTIIAYIIGMLKSKLKKRKK